MTSCKQPDLNARLGDLCAEGAGAGREELEAHLLICDQCWAEFQILNQTLEAIRAEGRSLAPIIAADVVQLAGMASRLERPFAGHWRIVAAASSIFAVMMGMAFPLEVAYAWATYGRFAIVVGPSIAFASLLIGLFSMSLLVRRTRTGDARAIAFGAGVVLAWTIGIALSLLPLLPTVQIVQARFQTMAGAIGWLKNTGQAMSLFLLLLVPLQMIVAFQRELYRGRAESVLRILADDPTRTIPRGSLFARPLIAGLMTLLVSAWWIGGTVHLLENLEPGDYMMLFMTLASSRAVVAVLGVITIFIWYVVTLEQVKREAATIVAGRSQLEIQ